MRKKINNDSDLKIPFQHLAPNNTTNDETTFAALDYALEQDSVKNIAVTGTYGSGKSSVLLSYEKKTRKHVFLNISLATFVLEADEKQEKQKGNPTPQKTSEEDSAEGDLPCKKNKQLPETTLQKIEKSILQQIFYRKSGASLPFSRFRRIRNMPRRLNMLLTVIIGVFIGFLLWLLEVKSFATISAKLFPSITLYTDLLSFDFILSWAFILISFTALFYIIRFCNKIRINKVGFQNTNIDLDTVQENSLLNKYLDEILYFFEVTKYDVVVIEDLDRFKNTEIFTKLRELNTLINNYEKIQSRKVVFIYALRDEVFADSSRTKFFEFIIPVIPFINCQNSGDILIQRRKAYPDSALGDLDEEFLCDIGLYIDDMRLLTNCINEFFIYDRKINCNVYQKLKTSQESDKSKIVHDRNKIFALIVYKNLYPEDFAGLSLNQGYLYSIFAKKAEIIEPRLDNLKTERQKLQEKFDLLQKQIPRNIAQLRILYVAEILKSSAEYTNARAEQYISDEQFSAIKTGTQLSISSYYYQTYSGYRHGTQPISYNFSEIERAVDPNFSYDEKELFLKSSGQSLLQDIARKDMEIRDVFQYPIAKLLQDGDYLKECILPHAVINCNFIRYLLRNGRIDENYFDYISYFYEGAISQSDKNFLLLIKNRQSPDFMLQLNKTENVLKRIKNDEWYCPALLNNSLFTSMLKTENSNITSFITTMFRYDRDNKETQFFKQYVCAFEHQEFFYTSLYSAVTEYTDWVSVLFDERNLEALYSFFIAVDVSHEETEYIRFIQSHIAFLYRDPDSDELKTVIEKLKRYGIQFNFTTDISKYSVFEELVNNNRYGITSENLTLIINANTVDEVQKTQNITDFLTRIKDTGDQAVISYVYDNLDITVKNVLLPLKDILSESESVFAELLNSEKLSFDVKKSIIGYNRNPIADISHVAIPENQESAGATPVPDLWSCLIRQSKVRPVWANVFAYFSHTKNEIDESLIVFLNEKNNSTLLTREEPLSDEELKEKKGNYDLVFKLYSIIIRNDELSLDSYRSLMNMCPWEYTTLREYSISDDKMQCLILEKKLLFTKENYAGIKAAKKVLLPQFVKAYFDDFIQNNAGIPVDSADLLMFVTSSLFSEEQKRKLFVTDFAAWKTITEQANLAEIGKVLLDLSYGDSLKSLSIVEIIKALAEQSTEAAVKLLNLQFDTVTEPQLQEIFTHCGSEYAELISRDGRRLSLKNTAENLELVKKLERKKYISSYKEKEKSIDVHS